LKANARVTQLFGLPIHYMCECPKLAKEFCKWTKLHKLQSGVNHANVNLVETHNEEINNFQVVDSPYALDDLAT
jgi:hypothetical protein